MVAAWEENPTMIRLFTRQYRLDLANQLGADGAKMDFSQFPEALAKLHELPTSSRDDEGEVFQNVAFFELLYLLNSGQFEVARDRLPSIEEGLQQFSSKISQARQLAFRYNMMVLYFIMEDYRDALRILNIILHDERTEHRQDIQQVARLFLLIFHFELGNHDLLEYLFRSAHRFFYTRGSLGRFEKSVLNFLRKTANLPTGSAMFPAFRELLGELKAIMEDGAVRTPPGVEEIVFWLRGTLEGRRMVELARE
jgi:tetratricopeptide (TPR) repeat protein